MPWTLRVWPISWLVHTRWPPTAYRARPAISTNLVKPDRENARRVMAALEAFGAAVETHGVTRTDFEQPGVVYQVGLPPRRVDLMTSISGLSFEEAWSTRLAVGLHGIVVPFLGKDALVANKRASGREKDLLDLRLLGSR